MIKITPYVKIPCGLAAGFFISYVYFLPRRNAPWLAMGLINPVDDIYG